MSGPAQTRSTSLAESLDLFYRERVIRLLRRTENSLAKLSIFWIVPVLTQPVLHVRES